MATTIIEHDHDTFGVTSIPGQSDGCDEPGCFSDSFDYGVDMASITNLINLSETCTQSVLNNCTHNGLTGLAWWSDRFGNKREYWHGSYSDDTVGCFCSLDAEGCVQDTNGYSVRRFFKYNPF